MRTFAFVTLSLLLVSCGGKEVDEVKEEDTAIDSGVEEQDVVSEQEEPVVSPEPTVLLPPKQRDTLRPEEIPEIFRKYLPPEALQNIPRPHADLPPLSLPQRPDIADTASTEEAHKRLIESIPERNQPDAVLGEETSMEDVRNIIREGAMPEPHLPSGDAVPFIGESPAGGPVIPKDGEISPELLEFIKQQAGIYE